MHDELAVPSEIMSSSGSMIGITLLVIALPFRLNAFTITGRRIHGEYDGLAIMSCSLHPQNLSIHMIEWRKGAGLSSLVYLDELILGNSSRGQKGGKFKDRKVTGTFFPSRGAHELTIYRTKPADDDMYTCRIKPRSYIMFKDVSIHLTLVVPPDGPPGITDVLGNAMNASNCNDSKGIPIVAGEGKHSFFCSIGGSKPSPTVAWHEGIGVIHRTTFSEYDQKGMIVKNASQQIDINFSDNPLLNCTVTVPDASSEQLKEQMICLQLIAGSSWGKDIIFYIIPLAVFVLLCMWRYGFNIKKGDSRKIKDHEWYPAASSLSLLCVLAHTCLGIAVVISLYMMCSRTNSLMGRHPYEITFIIALLAYSSLHTLFSTIGLLRLLFQSQMRNFFIPRGFRLVAVFLLGPGVHILTSSGMTSNQKQLPLTSGSAESVTRWSFWLATLLGEIIMSIAFLGGVIWLHIKGECFFGNGPVVFLILLSYISCIYWIVMHLCYTRKTEPKTVEEEQTLVSGVPSNRMGDLGKSPASLQTEPTTTEEEQTEVPGVPSNRIGELAESPTSLDAVPTTAEEEQNQDAGVPSKRIGDLADSPESFDTEQKTAQEEQTQDAGLPLNKTRDLEKSRESIDDPTLPTLMMGKIDKPETERTLRTIQGALYKITSEYRSKKRGYAFFEAKDQYNNKGLIPAPYLIDVHAELSSTNFRWFTENSDLEEIEEILKHSWEHTNFLVSRQCNSNCNMLSLRYKDQLQKTRVEHYEILGGPTDEAPFYLNLDDESNFEKSFDTLPELISFLKFNSAGIEERLHFKPLMDALELLGGEMKIDAEKLETYNEVGSGRFGVIYCATYAGQKVAVKQFKEEGTDNEEFVDEAWVMMKLKHENLVKLFGVCRRDKHLCLVMEFMENGALNAYLEKNRKYLQAKDKHVEKKQEKAELEAEKKLNAQEKATVTRADLLKMCINICEAMKYLEENNFVHRDLAGRNCLVGLNNFVKVADFGLSRLLVESVYAIAHASLFPVRWSAPEVLAKDSRSFQSKSDVWSFGVVMWEVFSLGEEPYKGRKNNQIEKMVCERGERLPQPDICPDSVRKLMMRCWEQSPDNRPSFQELLEDLNMLT